MKRLARFFDILFSLDFIFPKTRQTKTEVYTLSTNHCPFFFGLGIDGSCLGEEAPEDV